MSDAAARREARIKRILENSESRLRNITARVDDELLSSKNCFFLIFMYCVLNNFLTKVLSFTNKF